MSDSCQSTEAGTFEGDDLVKFCDGRFGELFLLWKQKHRGAAIPRRSDFDFFELRPWLGQVVLFDVVDQIDRADVDFRYRLVGTRITSALGVDPTGHLVSEFCLTADRATALSNLRRIASYRLPRYRTCMRPCIDGHSFTPNRLFLPLADDGATVNMIMMYGDAPRTKVNQATIEASLI